MPLMHPLAAAVQAALCMPCRSQEDLEHICRSLLCHSAQTPLAACCRSLPTCFPVGLWVLLGGRIYCSRPGSAGFSQVASCPPLHAPPLLAHAVQSYAPAPAPDYGGHDHEYSDDDTYYYPRELGFLLVMCLQRQLASWRGWPVPANERCCVHHRPRACGTCRRAAALQVLLCVCMQVVCLHLYACMQHMRTCAPTTAVQAVHDAHAQSGQDARPCTAPPLLQATHCRTLQGPRTMARCTSWSGSVSARSVDWGMLIASSGLSPAQSGLVSRPSLPQTPLNGALQRTLTCC